MKIWLHRILTLCVLLACSPSAQAQVTWRQTAMTESVVSVVSTNGVLYALTNAGIYRSTDAQSWQQLKKLSITDSYGSIVALKSGELFVFGYSNYLVSKDSGKTWTNVNQNGFSTRVCISDDLDYMYAGENDPIERSTDKGAHWAPSSQGTSQGFFDIGVITQGGDGAIYAANQGISGGMLYKSTNHGSSWTLIHAEQMNDILSVTEQYGTLWVIYSDKLMYSDDGGVNWNVALSIQAPKYLIKMLPIGENEEVGWFSQLGMTYSGDRGNTWEASNTGLHGSWASSIMRLHDGTILVATDSGIFLSNSSSGVRDHGTSSKEMLTISPNPARDLVEIRWSDNSINRWELCDELGRLVTSALVQSGQSRQTINTSSLAKGVYYLRGYSSKGIVQGKLMIAR